METDSLIQRVSSAFFHSPFHLTITTKTAIKRQAVIKFYCRPAFFPEFLNSGFYFLLFMIFFARLSDYQRDFLTNELESSTSRCRSKGRVCLSFSFVRNSQAHIGIQVQRKQWQKSWSNKHSLCPPLKTSQS